jgi:hypothetical protein
MRSYASYSGLTVSGFTQMLWGVTPVRVMWVPAWKTVVQNYGDLTHLIGTSQILGDQELCTPARLSPRREDCVSSKSGAGRSVIAWSGKTFPHSLNG